MIFPNLLGSIIYQVVTYALILAMTSTSILPVIQQLPRATAVYLGMMQRLGLLQPDPTAPMGVRAVASKGVESIMPPINSEGEPVGLLLSDRAFSSNSKDVQLSAQMNPLSISRVQSAYRGNDVISGVLVVTFTVSNNWPPAVLPQLPVSATITDTINVVSAIDLSKDRNVIHNVLLADTLTEYASFVTASPAPDRFPVMEEMAWSLGDIQPLSSVTATLIISVPTSTAGFVELDTGASAWGTLESRAVSARARSVSLAPDTIDGQPIGDWLKWTVDADKYDEYMLAKTAELGQDPLRMFEHVRSLAFESYQGSLRGTRGTLWSQAGNSMDQASLLIAMLRASSIPSRYRHGTLNEGNAQKLILSMFPTPTSVIGHVPQGTEISNPQSDPHLLAETADHWWVEAYLPGLGWRDLDPSFQDANVGQSFVAGGSVATDGTDRIAEIPDTLRHKVTITLRVEEYHPLNVGNSGLANTYPLAHTFNAVELVGNPVTLGHLVNTESASGLVFYWVRHNYVPYLQIEGRSDLIEGQSYQDLASNFPFGTFLITGLWLIVNIRDSKGNVETHTREIVDKLGFEARQSGGTVSVSYQGGTSAIINEFDNLTLLFAPSLISPDAAARRSTALVAEAGQLKRSQDLLQEIEATNTAETPQGQQTLKEVRGTFQKVALGQSRFRVLYYCLLSDSVSETWSVTTLVKSYHDSPRIIIASSISDSEKGSLRQILDLRRDSIRAIAYPQQALLAQKSFLSVRGVADTLLEGDVMQQTTSAQAVSAAAVLEQADQQRIPYLYINSSRLQKLAGAQISDKAKAHIVQAVRSGMTVLVPERMVPCGNVTTIAWWQINPQTGEMVGVGEDGTRMAETALRYINVFAVAAAFLTWLAGWLAEMAVYIAFLIAVLSLLFLASTVLNPPMPRPWPDWERVKRRTKEILRGMDDQVRGALPLGTYGE